MTLTAQFYNLSFVEKCLRLVNPTDQITTQSDPGNENASVTSKRTLIASITLSYITQISCAVLHAYRILIILYP